MRHTRRKDRLGNVPVEVHFWRWRRIPVMAAIYVGKMDSARPPWHITAAWIALEVVSVLVALHDGPLAPLRNPDWTIWP